MRVDVVVPSARPGPLVALLHSLERFPGEVIVVDGRARGPAAARNAGWRASSAEWVAFLDDDVVPAETWAEDLLRDLERVTARVAGSQGRVVVPLPPDRRPTDWERNVQGLERAKWATADMAYRRDVLEELGGFDERFPRAYREDSDLALRALRAGYELRRGTRRVSHPVGPASPWISLTRQSGNADDVLMRVKHGAGWRGDAGAPEGRLRRHLLSVGAGLLGAGALLAGRRRLAALALSTWAATTVELALARIRPGPYRVGEILTMAATSVPLPFVAAAQAARGWLRHARPTLGRPRTKAVLFDRDGTLVEDVPYNGDPDKVALQAGARAALARCRAAGLRVAVVSNQSGIARGLVSRGDVDAVNARIESQLGPVSAWLVCPHAPDAGCACRKPRPGLIHDAARRLRVTPSACVLVGDIGSDVDAARAAGARAVLVPTPRTERAEVAAAPLVAADLVSAVDLILEGRA